MGHNVCPTARSFPCSSKSRVGFAVPSWCFMMMTQASTASRALDDFGDRALRRELDPASAAMLDSQAGPYAARVFTACPTSPELCLPSPLFWALLLRQLRMPLPLAPAACRLRAPGYCAPVAGPSTRQLAFAAKQEPLSSSQQHVRLRGLNVEPGRPDERRIEVIATGLLLGNGAQVAADTTLVAPFTSCGAPRRLRGRTAGAALQVAHRTKARAP